MNNRAKQGKQKKKGRFSRGVKAGISCILVVLLVFSFTNAGKTFRDKANRFFSLERIPVVTAEYPLNIYFYSVGKADAILLECDGSYALIDAGTYDCGEKVAVEMKALGITELDAVFASHPDSDHIGGLSAILAEFSVPVLYQPQIPKELLPESEEYLAMNNAASAHAVDQVFLRAGERIEFSGAALEILSPVGDYLTVNDYSLVIRLIYGDVSVLLCGDIEGRAEKLLYESDADLTADVIKIAHHGSSTSSSEEFLSAVSPRYAVISTGYDRSNLPRKDVLQRLENMGIILYRTDTDGTIILSSDGQNIVFTCENKGEEEEK